MRLLWMNRKLYRKKKKKKDKIRVGYNQATRVR